MIKMLKRILLYYLSLVISSYVIINAPILISVNAQISEEDTYNIEICDELDNNCFNGHYYAVFFIKSTWEEAKSYCENLGGHLATITSKGENDFIFSKIKNISNRGCWIGGSDTVIEDRWEWVTSENFNYINFASNEPNGSGDHMQIYCASGLWDDTIEDDLIFICEWDYNPLAQDISFVSCSNDLYNDAMLYKNHLYKVFENKTSWLAAKQYCEQIGGHLATITSTDENKSLFRYINLNGFNSLYLGASDMEQEGVWKWVTDEPFDYSNFVYNEPDSSGDYLQFYKMEGGWDDTNSESEAFLCEWSDVCIVDNTMKFNHEYVNISKTDSTCQQKGITIDKCSICNYQREKFLSIVDCKYGNWEILSGNKLIPPIKKEKYCVYCGNVQTVEDWSFVWVPIIVGIIILASILGFVNYIKMLRK